jgi:hypothetical protein
VPVKRTSLQCKSQHRVEIGRSTAPARTAGMGVSGRRDTFRVISVRVIAPSSGSGQRNTLRSAQHIPAAAVKLAIALQNAPSLRPRSPRSRRKCEVRIIHSLPRFDTSNRSRGEHSKLAESGTQMSSSLSSHELLECPTSFVCFGSEAIIGLDSRYRYSRGTPVRKTTPCSTHIMSYK